MTNRTEPDTQPVSMEASTIGCGENPQDSHRRLNSNGSASARILR